MNFKKVENYVREKLETYKECFPAELFDGLEMSTHSGSFGACLLSLKNNYYSISAEYVGNYSAIDQKISYFITRSYERLTSKIYEEQKKEDQKGMYCLLEIYNDNKKVNTFEFKHAKDVKNELIKILIAEKRRGVKTTWKPIPYSSDMKVIQKWSKESAGLSHDTKYIYSFKNIEY